MKKEETFPNYMAALAAAYESGLYYTSRRKIERGVKTSLESIKKAGFNSGTPATILVANITGRKRPVFFCSVEEKDFSSKFGMMSARDLLGITGKEVV